MLTRRYNFLPDSPNTNLGCSLISLTNRVLLLEPIISRNSSILRVRLQLCVLSSDKPPLNHPSIIPEAFSLSKTCRNSRLASPIRSLGQHTTSLVIVDLLNPSCSY